MKEIDIRRSIREYLDQDISKEDVLKIIKAGMQAPSARNQQPWEFVVSRNKEQFNLCSNRLKNAWMVKDCNVCIIYCINEQRLTTPHMMMFDMGSCITNSLLEATSLGIGSCWCGVYPNLDRVKEIREVFQIEENLTPIAIVAFGYPKNEFEFIDRFDINRIHGDL